MTAVEYLLDYMNKNQYFIGDDLLKAFQNAITMQSNQSNEIYIKGYIAGLDYTLNVMKSKENK